MTVVAPPTTAEAMAGYVEVARAIAARDPQAVAAALSALHDSPETVALTLRAHHLVGLVRRDLADLGDGRGVDPALVQALAAAQPIARATPGELRSLFVEVRDALEPIGIPVLLLKGQSFAERLYGGLDRRPQFDVDVLVPRRAARRARRVLVARGFRRTDYDLHSETLVRGTAKVDIHHCLRAAPAYALREATLWRDALDITIAGERARTLSDEHTVLLLVLGLFEDLGQGMARLKQLVDLVRLLEKVDATLDWPQFFIDRAAENLLRITLTMLILVVEVMQAQAVAPRLVRRLAAYSPMACDGSGDRDRALGLLAAPRKAPANLAWFADVYPGWFTAYLAQFWWGGFPANLRQLRSAWVIPSLRRALFSVSRSR